MLGIMAIKSQGCIYSIVQYFNMEVLQVAVLLVLLLPVLVLGDLVKLMK